MNDSKRNVALDTAFVTPFLSSVKSVLTTMANTEVQPQAPQKAKSNRPQGDLAAIMPMATKEIVGQLIISFQAPTILAIAESMLMDKFTEINDEILDVAGELTNMITGSAKATISETHDFDMARPFSVLRQEYEKLKLTAENQIIVPYKTAAGLFFIELGFVHIE